MTDKDQEYSVDQALDELCSTIDSAEQTMEKLQMLKDEDIGEEEYPSILAQAQSTIAYSKNAKRRLNDAHIASVRGDGWGEE